VISEIVLFISLMSLQKIGTVLPPCYREVDWGFREVSNMPEVTQFWE